MVHPKERNAQPEPAGGLHSSMQRSSRIHPRPASRQPKRRAAVRRRVLASATPSSHGEAAHSQRHGLRQRVDSAARFILPAFPRGRHPIRSVSRATRRSHLGRISRSAGLINSDAVLAIDRFSNGGKHHRQSWPLLCLTATTTTTTRRRHSRRVACIAQRRLAGRSLSSRERTIRRD